MCVCVCVCVCVRERETPDFDWLTNGSLERFECSVCVCVCAEGFTFF